MNFWLEKKLFSLRVLRSCPTAQDSVKGRIVVDSSMIQAKSWVGLCRVSDSALHEMLRTVVRSLVSPCKSSWWLFRGGQHGLGGKCWYVGINSVRKLCNSAICYVIPVIQNVACPSKRLFSSCSSSFALEYACVWRLATLCHLVTCLRFATIAHRYVNNKQIHEE